MYGLMPKKVHGFGNSVCAYMLIHSFIIKINKNYYKFYEYVAVANDKLH